MSSWSGAHVGSTRLHPERSTWHCEASCFTESTSTPNGSGGSRMNVVRCTYVQSAMMNWQSSLSVNPPCPGMRLSKSLILYARFTAEAKKPLEGWKTNNGRRKAHVGWRKKGDERRVCDVRRVVSI